MASECPDHLRSVRLLPCCARDLGHECYGPIEAHHAGRKPGMGMKAHDMTCIPLCRGHHTGAGIHALHGPFKGWTRAQVREWQDKMIDETIEAILTESGIFPIPF